MPVQLAKYLVQLENKNMFGLKWNYITIVTVVLGLGFLGYLDFKLYYAYVAPVNYEIKQEVIKYLRNADIAYPKNDLIFGHSIVHEKGITTNEGLEDIGWGNELVRLNVRDGSEIIKGDVTHLLPDKSIVEISKDNGGSWQAIAEFEYGCGNGFVYNELFFCFGDNMSTPIYSIDKSGSKRLIKKLFSRYTSRSINAVFLDDNELVIVWEDWRGRHAGSEVILSSFGPYLTMAGKLNLDTLDFKEYLIQRGPRAFYYDDSCIDSVWGLVTPQSKCH